MDKHDLAAKSRETLICVALLFGMFSLFAITHTLELIETQEAGGIHEHNPIDFQQPRR